MPDWIRRIGAKQGATRTTITVGLTGDERVGGCLDSSRLQGQGRTESLKK